MLKNYGPKLYNTFNFDLNNVKPTNKINRSALIQKKDRNNKIEKNNMTRPIVSVANHMFILRQKREEIKNGSI